MTEFIVKDTWLFHSVCGKKITSCLKELSGQYTWYITITFI